MSLWELGVAVGGFDRFHGAKPGKKLTGTAAAAPSAAEFWAAVNGTVH